MTKGDDFTVLAAGYSSHSVCRWRAWVWSVAFQTLSSATGHTMHCVCNMDLFTTICCTTWICFTTCSYSCAAVDNISTDAARRAVPRPQPELFVFNWPSLTESLQVRLGRSKVRLRSLRPDLFLTSVPYKSRTYLLVKRVFTAWMPLLSPNPQRQSTRGNLSITWRPASNKSCSNIHLANVFPKRPVYTAQKTGSSLLHRRYRIILTRRRQSELKSPIVSLSFIECRATSCIVVRPTTSCFADWSKRRHVTLSIFQWRTIHDNLSSDIFT